MAYRYRSSDSRVKQQAQSWLKPCHAVKRINAADKRTKKEDLLEAGANSFPILRNPRIWTNVCSHPPLAYCMRARACKRKKRIQKNKINKTVHVIVNWCVWYSNPRQRIRRISPDLNVYKISTITCKLFWLNFTQKSKETNWNNIV